MRSSLCRAVSLLALALLAPCILSGCYAAAAGAVLGVLAATDSSSGGSPDRPPSQPVIPPPERLDGAHVRVAYFLQDDRDGEIEVDFEWQPEDRSREFAPATEWTEDPRSEGRRIRVEGGKSREAIFVWNALQDFGPVLDGKSVARVRFRITPAAGGQVGESAVSEPFVAGNEVPEVVPPIEQGATGGVIPLTFEVRDSTSDPITFEVEYRLGEHGAARSWRAGEMSLVGITPETEFKLENGAARVTLFWDTLMSPETATIASKEIHVRITPHDAYGSPDQGKEAGPLTLDNNDDPDVEIIDLASAPDRSFEIPVRFVVRDEDEHPVHVVLQWALQGEEFPGLPIPRDASPEELFPSLADLAFLEDLLSSDDPEMARLRRDHHICSEAPLLVPVSVDARVSPYSLEEPGGAGAAAIRPLSSGPHLAFSSLSFVRAGMVFRPPVQGRSRGFPAAPFDPASDIFLIGRAVLPYHATEVPIPPPRIARFDPATSLAILDARGETVSFLAQPIPGSRLLVSASEGLVGLSSSREGLIHTFVWDSSKDTLGLEVPLNPGIRLRAVGIDSQVGPKSRESAFFELQSGVLEDAAGFATSSDPQALATGDLNGDGLVDLVAVNSRSSRASVYWSGTLSGIVASGPSTAATVAPDQVLATAGNAVAVAVGDLNGDGKEDVAVPNQLDGSCFVYLQGPGGLLGKGPMGDGTHGPSWVLAAGQNPRFAAIGDLNGDGLKDIVLTNARASVFLQRASGSGLGKDVDALGRFTPDVHLCTEPNPGRVFLGDITNDGKEDVIICGLLSTNLRIFHQKEAGALGLPPDADCGDGFLRPDHILKGAGFNLSSLAIGDVNDDALNDVVAVDGANFRAGVFWQRPSGELGALPDGEGRVVPDQNLRTGRLPAAAAIADLDGDGKNDVVLVSIEKNTVEVYLQGEGGALGLQGSGAAAPAAASQGLSAGGAPLAVATADLNGDGRPDVVVGNGTTTTTSSTIGLYLQVYAGALFARPARLTAGASPEVVALGEVNADGRADVLVLSKGAGTLGVHLQTLSGSVLSTPSQLLDVGTNPVSLAIGDVGGDGGNDVAVVSQPSGQSSAVSVFPSDGASNDGLPFDPERSRRIVQESGLVAVALGDLDSDGRNDVLAVNQSNDTLSVFLQKDGGAFAGEPDQVLAADRNPLSAAIGDLNGDGRSDVAVVNRNRDTTFVYHQGASPDDLLGSGQDAGGHSLPDLRLRTEGFPVFAAIGDVDGDGENDLVVLSRAAETVGVYLQALSGTLGVGEDDDGLVLPNQRLATGRGPEAMAIGDIDGDSRNDVLVVNASANVAGIYLQGASGALGFVRGAGEPASPNRELLTGEFPVSIAVGDLNGDGRNDCAIANRERGNAPDYTVDLYLAR